MRTWITICLFIVMCAHACHAEIIELVDGTQISGKLIHAYRDSVEIRADGGEVIVMPLAKIRSIAFKRVKARPDFETPEKTLDHYLGLVRKGKLEKTVSCYRLMYQKMMSEQIENMTQTERAKMQEEMLTTEFKIGDAEVNGKKAVIPVTMSHQGKSQEAEMLFIMENGEWKLAMPMNPDTSSSEKLPQVCVTRKNGAEITGGFFHFFNNAVHLRGPSGEFMTISTEKIKTIKTISTGPRPEFSTPSNTFSYYLSLTRQGRLEQASECFRLMLQNAMLQQIASMSAEDKALVQKETAKTEFEFNKAEITGNEAVLPVVMVREDEKQEAEIRFVKENGEWKMSTSPMLGNEPEK